MNLAGAAAGAQEGLQEYLTRRLVAAQQQQQAAAQQAAAERAARSLQLQEQQAADLHAQRTAPAPIKRTVITTIGPRGEPMQKAMTDDELAGGVPSYVAPPPVKEPARHVITTIGPKGGPMQRSMTDDELAGGVPSYVAPKAGADPETVALRNDLLRMQVDAAKQKQADASAVNDKSRASMQSYGDEILGVLDALIDKDGNLKPNAAGVVGGIEGALPNMLRGETSQNALADIDRLQGLLDIGKLNEMKQQSRTGATGFGALNEKELGIIESSAAKLRNRRQGEGNYAAELKRIRDQIMEGRAAQPTNNTATPAPAPTPAPKAGGFRVVGVR